MTIWDQIAVAATDAYGAIQQRDELAGFLEYLDARLPPAPAILEIGSDAGGTLYAWRKLRPRAHVVAVSLAAGVYATPRPIDPHGAVVLDADSHEPAARARARELLGRPPALVFVDGDHSLAGCRADCEWASELLEPGGLLALHDVSPHSVDGIGCPDVWGELLDDRRYAWPQSFVKPGAGWGGIGVLTRA